MSQPAFAHRPVMADEVVALLGPVPAGILVDATLGGGGHAEAVLDAHPQLRLVGVDRDPDALVAARARLARFGDRVVALHHARFDAITRLVPDGQVSAVLFDLGVSSPQLDRPERGFSYRAAGPLDMRMDTGDATATTAADVVNTWPEADLARLFAEHGETRWARRIAASIVRHRPVEDTSTLAELIRSAIPAAARRTGGHPAKRVFQAVRVAVNGELDILPAAIDNAVDLLAPGGRIVVLAYHSGEDRIVKGRLRDAESGGCTCPPGFPCACGATPKVRLLKRGATKPTPAEIAANPRAESARLRAAERLPS